MLLSDYAIIYKKKTNLYYSISQKYGKMILSNYFSNLENFSTHSFFLVEYEYLIHDYKSMIIRNNSILKVQDISLFYMINCNNMFYHSILIFSYIFDYFLEYNEEITFFKKFYLFFNNNIHSIKEIISFVFDFLIELQIITIEEIENVFLELDNTAFKMIEILKKKFILHTPFLENHINTIFNQLKKNLLNQ